MGQGDIGILIGLPVAAATFATLLTSMGPTLILFIGIGAIAVAFVAAGIAQLLSGASFSILGTGLTLPQVTGWSLRFLFTTTFLTAYYAANLISGLNVLGGMPYYFGVLIVGVLSTMFIFGVFSMSSGGSSGDK